MLPKPDVRLDAVMAVARPMRMIPNAGHQVKIDARPFLGISADDHVRIEEIIKDWVREGTSE